MKKIISNDQDKHTAIELIKAVDISKRPYVFELYKQVKKRSNTQNAYLHVCISLFAIEIGLTLDEAKTHLKRNCSFMIYEKKGEKFLVHTSKQTSTELTAFIEWIRNYSAKQGIYIPSADEYYSKREDYDNIIDYNKQYL